MKVQHRVNFYSSYFTPPNERPEKGLKKFYNSIINEATKDLTLYNRFEFDNHFVVLQKSAFYIHFGKEVANLVYIRAET